jgi:lysophospholipase L1-like esterase
MTPFDGDPESEVEVGSGPVPPVAMAHFEPKVGQAKRLMAHPVRRGPIGAIAGLTAAESHRAGRITDERSRTAMRRRDLALVLALLLVATVVAASLPGGWGNSASSAGTPGGMAAAAFVGDVILATPTPTLSPSPSATPTLSATPSAGPSGSVRPSASAKPSATPAAAYRFVALGDSLTAWPTASPWPSRLDAKDSRLTLVHNAGVPGDTTAQMLSRFKRDVVAYNPQVLFVLGGTNDMGKSISQATSIANLRAIIVAAQAKKMRVFLLTVPPQSSSSAAPVINSFNAALLHLANSYRVVLIDIHAPLSTSTGVYQTKFTSDGLHFNSLGAQTVANAVYSRIHRLGY